MMDIKTNIKNTDVWLRGLFILIFGALLYFAFMLVGLLVAFQFLSKLLTGELNRQLADFSGGLLSYISQILAYATFQSDERPFPFNPWPSAEQAKSITAPRARGRRRKSEG